MSATNTAPRQVESIPTVTAPVDLPELRMSRGQYLAGVITGGVLLAIDLAGYVYAAFGVTW